MKKFCLGLVAVVCLSPSLLAQSKSAKKRQAPVKVTAVDSNEIQWVTIDDAQRLMKQAPRKVYIDVYTGWCGWCKVMDKKTFTNKGVIKYINAHYYAVKFDAEQTDSVHFMGNHYGFEGRANQFAVQLLKGQLSYPTTVIMEENFQNPQVIPGYLEVKNIEPILKYLGENVHKTTPWETYMKTFTPTWE